MTSKESHSAMENNPSGTSAALYTGAKSSSTDTSVIPKTFTGSQQADENDKFSKKPSRFPADRDFRTTPQYNDQESYMNQRHHSIGLGVFNTDEIDDLPPRHREKVRNVYKKIVDFANTVLPPHVLTTSHGGPIQVSDLLNLKGPEAAKSDPGPCSEVSDCSNYNRNNTTPGRENASHSGLHKPFQGDGHLAESTERKGGSKSSGIFISSIAKELRQSNIEEDIDSKFCNDSVQSEHFQKSGASYLQKNAVPRQTYSNINFERASSNGPSDSKSNKKFESLLHVHKGSESKLCDKDGYINSKNIQNKESSYPQKKEEKKYKNSGRSPYKNKPSDPKYGNRPVSQNLHKSDDSEFSKDGSVSSIKDFQNRGSHVPRKHIASENNRTNRDDNFASSSNSKCRTFSSASSDKFSLKSDDLRDKRLSGKESKSSYEDETFNKNDSCISKGSSIRENRHSVDDLSNAYSKCKENNSLKNEKKSNSMHMCKVNESTIDSSMNRLKHTISSDSSIVQHGNKNHSLSKESRQHCSSSARELKPWDDSSFFVCIKVSENSSTLQDTFWDKFFRDTLEHCNFTLECCCKFSQSLILNFKSNKDASEAFHLLIKVKMGNKYRKEPHMIYIGDVQTHLIRPCNCRKNILDDCNEYFEKTSTICLREYRQKVAEIRDELDSMKNIDSRRFSEQQRYNLEELLTNLKSMEFDFNQHCEKLKQEVMVSSNV